MTKYNFHEQLEKVKGNVNYKLPEDINKPVFDFLEKIGCKIGAETLKTMQDHLNYGQIELRRIDLPNSILSIQVDCGMAEGWKDCELRTDKAWSTSVYKTVKNYNLNKRKLTKG